MLVKKIAAILFKKKFVNSSYGIKLKANWGDPAFEVYYFGLYGKELSDIISSQKKPFYFLDIGANQGLFAILAAKNSNCIKSFAFEPIPSTASLLKTNVSINQLNKKIVVNEMAISNIETDMQICYDDPAKASLVSERQRKKNQKLLFEFKECKIKVVNYKKLDLLKINDNKKILVKIDVEGLEEVVINELFKTNFSKNITEIIYEVVESEKWNKIVDHQKIISTLKDFGFRKFKKLDVNKAKGILKYDMHAIR